MRECFVNVYRSDLGAYWATGFRFATRAEANDHASVIETSSYWCSCRVYIIRVRLKANA